jgi:hypothetical protein
MRIDPAQIALCQYVCGLFGIGSWYFEMHKDFSAEIPQIISWVTARLHDAALCDAHTTLLHYEFHANRHIAGQLPSGHIVSQITLMTSAAAKFGTMRLTLI